MDIIHLALAALALLAAMVVGAFVNHHLEKSKNPKAASVAARLDTAFDQVDAELAKGPAAIAEDIKANVAKTLAAIEASEQKAQADVEAALARQQAVKTANAGALATIQGAVAPVVAQDVSSLATAA